MTTLKADRPAPRAPDPGPPLVSLDDAVFSDVSVRLDARLGEVTLTVKDLLALRAGDVVKLDAQLQDAVGLYVGEQLVGRGEIVAVDDAFAVRLVEIATAR